LYALYVVEFTTKPKQSRMTHIRLSPSIPVKSTTKEAPTGETERNDDDDDVFQDDTVFHNYTYYYCYCYYCYCYYCYCYYYYD
jgi:hypothetical protein